MKCRICKNPTLPGARLCGPCRAALNRARHAGEGATLAAEGSTVSRPGSRPSGPGRLSGPAPVPDDPGEVPKLRRWPAAVMIASVVAAAAAYAWLGSAGSPGPAEHPGAMHGAPAPVASPASGGAKPSSDAMPSLAQGDETAGTHAALPPAEPTVYLRDRELTSSRRDVASSRSQSGGRSPAAPVAPATGVAEGASSGGAPELVAARNPGALPGVTASEDPLQALDEALAQCGGNFIERIACGQRARFRYCDGYWGRAPQCPSGAVAVNR
jgi:hypothetical protein